MSDVAEMCKEFARAMELHDFAAAQGILRELHLEAQRTQQVESAEILHAAILRGDLGAAMAATTAMAIRAARVDSANGQILGDEFVTGRLLINQALA